ncbi:terminase large subunit domain-containing protein [Brevundimonas sp. M20]|uniref:terminase large subunit domain-containing protein n=1 Tax=Brevundimonas sp. M20 TaxID=2591463 RepID=UPI001F104903|nr:terminase family protein [Brevundimonas sp. M20]
MNATPDTPPRTERRLRREERREEMVFHFHPDDPDATLDSIEATMADAAGEGRVEDFGRLGRIGMIALRFWQARRRHRGQPVVSDAAEPPPSEPDPEPVPPPLDLRPAQTPPEALPNGEPWRTWLFLGGRGAGKTQAGAEWLADQAEALGAGGRLALIGPTLHDVREVMIEGVSGIRSLPRWTAKTRPVFESSRRRLKFANGCIAYAFSAEDPDSLRGPQFSAAWADEFCAWRPTGARGAAETLALLRMGLRLPGPLSLGRGPSARSGTSRPDAAGMSKPTPFAGRYACAHLSTEGGEGDHPEPPATDGGGVGPRLRHPPRLLVTTTPRPMRALIRLKDEASCALTHAGSADNAAHLAPGFIEGLRDLYGGTRREAQELDGRIVDLDGALFTATMMALARSPDTQHPSPLGAEGRPPSSSPKDGTATYERIVVAIDPPATATGDACGIIAAASRLRPDGVREAVVLADRSAHGLSPEEWARRAVALAHEVGATCIVAEVNQGGDMVASVLKAVDRPLPVRTVRATKGKMLRAEPVAALYEQGRVKHAGLFDALEEELMLLGAELGEGSLDRADALVWAVTDLLIDRPGQRGPRLRML